MLVVSLMNQSTLQTLSPRRPDKRPESWNYPIVVAGNGIDIKSMKHLLVGCRSLNEMNNVIIEQTIGNTLPPSSTYGKEKALASDAEKANEERGGVVVTSENPFSHDRSGFPDES